MKCETPITLFRKERDYDHPTRMKSDVVPCGKCPACLKRRQSSWIFRLEQEQKTSSSSAFITLTYSDPNLPYSKNGYPELSKKDHQLFMKRLRKTIRHHFPHHNKKLRYYSCGEYGDQTHRPHYHSIMFNLPQEYIDHPELLERDWKNGQVQVATCNSKTISYTTKYINKTLYTHKQHDLDDRQKEFSLMSKGLGQNYLTPAIIAYYKAIKTPYLVKENGEKATMPKYYKDKIFTSEEKHLINHKTKKYLQENPTFNSEKHKFDYIRNEIKKQEKRNLLERQKL